MTGTLLRQHVNLMGGKSLVIVESPTKAKTISRFLDKNYIIKASNGHIRDLPNNAAEIPQNLKKEPWARLGVNVEKDFEAIYVIPAKKKDHVKALKDAMKDASVLYLATDEDREGESISWHLLETLKPKIPVKRLVFHEITKDAIKKALESPRTVDENLVRAQETRRIIDRLYGYELSPILWKKMAPGLSAGRVQSVAVRLLVERERARVSFKSATYWGVKGVFEKFASSENFEAELVEVGGKRVCQGKDFDPNTGQLINPSAVVLLTKDSVTSLLEELKRETPQVTGVEEKPWVTKPAAPFVTSTLQQEANRKLRFSAKRTMQVAQQLYENGFITYMRTDSTTLSDQAINAARTLIRNDFGNDYLPAAPRLYQTKVKNAQEAHEAIRPAGDHFTSVDEVRSKLGNEAAKLYDLIWKRTVASQMTDARGTHITVSVQQGKGLFRASGKTITFPGYLRAYVEGSDDPEADLADQERILPKVQEGEKLSAKELTPVERTTQPPPRYTEGSLIKELERLGIGRPSTWATIVELVLSRSYAFKRGTALVPTYVAFAVVKLLEQNFPQILDYEFTANLEDDLDAISRGEATGLDYLKQFYFGSNGKKPEAKDFPGLKNLVSSGEANIDPKVVCGIPLGTLPSGETVEVRIGRYGPFLTDGTNRASLSESLAPDELDVVAAKTLLEQAAKQPEALGTHPATGLPVYVKIGRFGPYVQLGEMSGEEKPKMSSLLPGMDPGAITLETALKLLELPKTLGKHPENGEDIIASNGKFGPYVKCGAETRSIPGTILVIDITLDQALELLKQPKTRGRASAQPAMLADVGKHPVDGTQLVVKSGRYGPYVTDGTVNASLPRGADPTKLTIEEAVNLLEARKARIAEDGGAPKRGRGKKTKAEAAPKASKKKEAAPKEKKEAKPKAKKAATEKKSAKAS